MKNLDLNTKLYLYITGAVIEKEKKYTIRPVNKNVVYIFENYDDFKNYFKRYMDDVREDLIDIAIYKRSKKGGVIALKGLCDHIITQSRLKNRKSNLNITPEEINDIHSRGKITAREKVDEWESLDLCAPGDAIGSAKDRCHYFEHNCHECLLEYASQKKEYDKMEFKVINPYNKENEEILIKIKK